MRALQTLFAWSAEDLLAKKVALSILRDHFLVKLVATQQQWLSILFTQDEGVLESADKAEGVNEVLQWLIGWRQFLQ